MSELRLSTIIADIRSGSGDDALMKKYGLSRRGLRLIMQMLVEKNAVGPSELAQLSPTYRDVANLLSSRKFPRVYVPGPIALKIYSHETRQYGYVRDISRNGFRAVGIAAEVGQELTLLMSLKKLKRSDTLEFQAACRWITIESRRKKYVMGGFELVHISAKTRVMWDAAIDFIRAQIEREEAKPPASLSDSGLLALSRAMAPDRPSREFSGSLDGVDILEVVQLLLLNGKKVLLSIKSSETHESLVHLRDGQIVHAVHGEMEGEEAFYASMGLLGGQFKTLPWSEPDDETIDVPGDFLILEAARRRDDPDSVTPPAPVHKVDRQDR